NPNSRLAKPVEILFETSQLEVTHPSPIAAIKNQQHAFWSLVVDWLRQQLSQGDLPVVWVNQCEGRRLVSNLWSGRRWRHPRTHDVDNKEKCSEIEDAEGCRQRAEDF